MSPPSQNPPTAQRPQTTHGSPTDEPSTTPRPAVNPDGDAAFRREGWFGGVDDATYSGALSFLRRTFSREVADADLVVTGIPYDCATSNRPGARFGPRAIRAASTQLAELPGFPFGFDPFDTLGVADYGDCYFDFGRAFDVVPVVLAHAREILANDVTLVSFGGDHFVTYPLLLAHHEIHGSMALIHFDAHSDTWPDDGHRIDHGSMFLRAAREELIDPSASVQVGIRTPNSDDHGFTIATAPWVQREGIEAVADLISSVIGDRPAYLTFDIDCLDPAFAPGTGTPVPGGLSTSEALGVIRSLGHLNIVGFDVVEVAPAYDHAEITSLAAASIVHDFICLVAEKHGATRRPYGLS